VAEGSPAARRGGVRTPDLETPFVFNADGSRNFLHPADVRGRWQRRKNVVYAALIAFYLALPWVGVGGHPAALFDIPRRQAFLFGLALTGEDFWLLFFVLSGAGFALIVATSLWGRVWCGFACPQTVFLEGVFRRIERLVEGPRDSRIRRNLGPLTGDKLARKLAKHGIFIALCVAIAHAFLAYFIPARELLGIVRAAPTEHWTAFLWATVMAALLYFDVAWFREQTCLVVCPYGRFQSALIDDDSVVIGYDAARGEPRVKATETGGDCIDCRRCVVVCPTGIDIRNGLQMECVGCSNCVDACDEIMDKLGRARGLIRYDSKRGFDGVRRRFLRPRVAIYAALGLIGATVFAVSVAGRAPFEVRALRTRGMPYTFEGDKLRNLFNVRVENKRAEARTFTLRAGPPAGVSPAPEVIVAQGEVTLDGLTDTTVPVFVTLPASAYREPFPVPLTVTDTASGRATTIELRVLGP